MVLTIMNKHVLVTGAGGQLGHSIKAIALNYPHLTFSFADRGMLDLSGDREVEQYLASNKVDVIINCAAYTAVDKAESEPEVADLINHKAVSRLAKYAKKYDIALVHISTDYVFNGKNYSPYSETDSTDPQSVYGLSKLAGEKAFAQSGVDGCIIRTSWLYSEYGHNFAKTMLRLGRERDCLTVVSDQVGTPTYAGDLAKVILESACDRGMALSDQKERLVSETRPIIYHYSNEGVASWFDFAKAIFELEDISCKVSPIETQEYPTPASRPQYSVLNKSKIKNEFDVDVPYWRDSLKECLCKIREQSE